MKLFRIWTSGLKEMPFKDISYLDLWQSFCSGSGTICVILVEDIMRNNSMK